MLNTAVKASSIANLTDARYFAAWHVEWLGFDLSPTGLEKLSLPEVKEIKDWIEGPKIVGELGAWDLAQSQELINFLDLEYVQVNMFTPTAVLNSLRGTTILKEVVIEPTTTAKSLETHLTEYFDYVDYFLIDFNRNGIDWQSLQQNQKLNTTNLAKLCQQFDILLSLDFDSLNTKNILTDLNPKGISVKGGLEEKVGFKSFDELDAIFESIEEEF